MLPEESLISAAAHIVCAGRLGRQSPVYVAAAQVLDAYRRHLSLSKTLQAADESWKLRTGFSAELILARPEVAKGTGF
jgi:hypothetical protein